MKRSWWYRFTFLLVLTVISTVAVIPTVFNFNEDSNFPVNNTGYGPINEWDTS